MDPRASVRYLRDCYRADNRAPGILDLFARKIEHRRLFERDRLLSGELDEQPVDAGRFEELAAAAALYAREKRLVYFAFPLLGRPPSGGTESPAGAPAGPRVLCAPLFAYPATLAPSRYGEDLLALTLEPDEGQLNAAALGALLGSEEAATPLVETLLADCAPPWSRDRLDDLVHLLGEALPGLDAEPLFDFPELAGEDELRRLRRRAQAPRLVAAGGLALVPRGRETRGVLHELGQLTGAAELSAPLRRLLGEPAEGTAAAPAADGEAVPAVLSPAQRRALASASRHPLTLVVGPPGTGKSFTLAAIALEHVARGESVLVAARTQQALDVVEEKIDRLLGEPGFVLRSGRRQYLKKLKTRLQDVLHGVSAPRPWREKPKNVRRRLARVRRALRQTGERFVHRAELERRWGELAEDAGGGWLAAAARGLASWRLGRLPAPWRLLGDYERAHRERSRLVSEDLRAAVRRRLDDLLVRRRGELKGLLQALRARQSAKQEGIFAELDFPLLLSAFPLWMTSFADVHRGLPFAPELFDLVIVDEATQCDMASCLPALQRGRRAVVTGDPRQLRHVSFLARARQRAYAERHSIDEARRELLDYRDRSLLDLVSDVVDRQDQVAFLDEHFRSAPAIIRFSNRRFYGGALRIMTRRPEEVRRRAVELVVVEDGRRGDDGVNAREAERLVGELAAWVEREIDLPAGRRHSLGVLSPFRAQAEHLGRRVEEALGLAAIERHRLLVGTPYAFQGEERDAMFLSFALDAASHPSAWRHLDRDDVFNVAVTRARSHQLVYASLAPRSPENRSELLRRYLEEIEAPPEKPPAADAVHDAYAREVAAALAARDFHVWPAYEIAGLVVDLLAERGGRSVGVDLIGYPGRFAEAFDLDRYQLLLRAGLPIFPLPLSIWREDPERCLDALEGMTETHRAAKPARSPR